jgi:hypothetical protein
MGIIMAFFDEAGQAVSIDRSEFCQRSYDILVNKVGFLTGYYFRFEYISSCDRNGRTSPKRIGFLQGTNGFRKIFMRILWWR